MGIVIILGELIIFIAQYHWKGFSIRTEWVRCQLWRAIIPFRRIFVDKIIVNLIHCNPLYAFVFVNVFNNPSKQSVFCRQWMKRLLDGPFLHEQHVRASRHIWMDGHRENKLVVFSVEVIKLIL